MCGIAGGIASTQATDMPTVLNTMRQTLAHRGPDGQGAAVRYRENWSIGLAHTRLAILDLSSAGAQPMRADHTPRWLTYNGEIYNFQTLRQELESLGYTFHSQTDSEVLLNAYDAYGCEVLSRLRGMFSFAVWDEDASQLFLARDSFGIKPLYFYQTDECFLFASEVRTLLASGLVQRRLNQRGLASYLQCGSVQAPDTIIDGVQCLLPGHSLTVTLHNHKLQIREDALLEPLGPHLLSLPSLPSSTREEAVVSLRQLLEESVRSHLVSDVPLGVFLSGGIDSSALVALLSQVTQTPPKTFSVVFREQEYSEAPHARLIADKFGTQHQEILLTENQLLAQLPHALASMDQPTIDGMNTFVISQAVKEADVTVALSGLGSDEIFAGYPSFLRAKQVHTASMLPGWLRRSASALGRLVLNGSVQREKFWDMLASDGSPQTACRITRQLFAPREIAPFVALNSEPFDILLPAQEDDLINTVSRCELSDYMANVLLRDTDCMSMTHGLEVRVPFVDPQIVQFVLGLPGRWKVDPRRPKSLLLDALGELLPQEIWQRPKVGFTLPFERWMQTTLRAEVEEALLYGRDWEAISLRPCFAQEVWQSFAQHPEKIHSSRPWALYVLHKWCEQHEVRV